jgi:hypothetical protein
MYFPTLTIYLGWSHLLNKRIPILTRIAFGRIMNDFDESYLHKCLAHYTHFTTICKIHFLDPYISFEHTQILTQLGRRFTHRPSIEWEVCPLHISIFSILNLGVLNDSQIASIRALIRCLVLSWNSTILSSTSTYRHNILIVLNEFYFTYLSEFFSPFIHNTQI